ncbi:MAG: hypothetical protein FH748_03010 [Balneolaceae bacterium]|nr:hypothetical protein [Balneolaceae bacterium]
MSTPSSSNTQTGDMPVAELRTYLKQLTEWAVNYFSTIEQRNVLPDIKPGETLRKLPQEAPETGLKMSDILHEFESTFLWLNNLGNGLMNKVILNAWLLFL